MARRRLEVEIVGDSTKLDKAFKSANRSARSFGRDISRNAGRGGGGGILGGALFGSVGKAGAVGAGIAVAGAVGVKTIKSLVAAAKEAEVAQANLSQAFSAAGVSTKKYGDQIDNAIQSTSKLAGLDDELVSNQFANLLRTTGSVAKATRDIALAANIARARKISLAAATKVVEKAENGQLRGLKSLGVQIDKNTTSTEAIEQAQKKFAGSAEAYGRTAAGAQDRLNVAFENVRERLGTKLLPIITKLSLKLIDFIDWSEKNWPKFAKAIEDAYRTAKPFIDNLNQRIQAIATVIRGVVNVIEGIKNGEWSMAWKGLKEVVVGAVKEMYLAFAKLPMMMLKALGKAAFAGIEKAFTAALNRIISLINKAIRAYNKIPLAPNLPTVGAVGGGGPSASGASAPAPDGVVHGERNPQVVNLVVDGKTLASIVTGHQLKASRRGATQTRGTIAGRNNNVGN